MELYLGVIAQMGGLYVNLIAILVGIFIIQVIASIKLFQKAGVPGWAAVVPFYNLYKMLEIARKLDYIWLLSGIVFLVTGQIVGLYDPLGQSLYILGLVFIVIINYLFIRSFVKPGIALLSIPLPFIVYPIAAFSKKVQYKDIVS